MALIKCPRCELNYIQEDEGVCKICKRDMKGESRDEIELCSICNEAPVMPGKDVCLACFNEMKASQDDNEEENDVTVEEATRGIDPVSTMDELIPDTQDEDVPEGISLESLSEEEDEDDDDENDEE